MDNMLITGISEHANKGPLSKLTSYAEPPATHRHFDQAPESPGGFVKHRLLGLSSSFAFCRSKMGPENFQQVPRWYWCYWSRHHPLRTSALKLDALYPPWRSRKEFISHLDLSHGLLVELWQLPHIAVSRTKCIGWFPSASPEAPPTIPHPALCPGRLLSVQPANGSSHLRRPEKMGYSFLWFWVSLWPVATLPGSSLYTTSLSGFFQASSASPGPLKA